MCRQRSKWQRGDRTVQDGGSKQLFEHQHEGEWWPEKPGFGVHWIGQAISFKSNCYSKKKLPKIEEFRISVVCKTALKRKEMWKNETGGGIPSKIGKKETLLFILLHLKCLLWEIFSQIFLSN